MMISSDPRPPAAGFVVRASRFSTFVPKQVEPGAATSQSNDLLMIQTENESDAATSRPTTVTPAPATTISVRRLFSVSRPGSARCSHAMRAPPMITDSTASAPMYHQSPACRNATAPPAPLGPAARIVETSELAPLIKITAPRMIPARPTAAMPCPDRSRDATIIPRMIIAIPQIANETQVT